MALHSKHFSPIHYHFASTRFSTIRAFSTVYTGYRCWKWHRLLHMGPTVHEREIEVAALHPGTLNQILSTPSTLVKHAIVYLYLYLPSTLLPMVNRSFSFAAPRLWNSLPRVLCLPPNIQSCSPPPPTPPQSQNCSAVPAT